MELQLLKMQLWFLRLTRLFFLQSCLHNSNLRARIPKRTQKRSNKKRTNQPRERLKKKTIVVTYLQIFVQMMT